MKKILSLVGGILAIAAFSGVQAHHSFAQFDQKKTMMLEGTIKTFEWTNPHAWIWIAIPDGKGGEQTWGIEAQSPSGLSRNGWSKRSFNPGDKVKIEIHPMQDGTQAGEFVRGVTAKGETLLPVS